MEFSYKLVKNLDRFSSIYRRDGFNTAAYVYFYDVASRITPFSIYRIMRLRADKIAPGFEKLPHGFSIRALTTAEAFDHAEDSRNDMTVAFVQEAVANDETCMGVFNGDQLAAYGWYADKPCHTRRELYVFFGNTHKYQHKGFTYPAYRGRRLHAFGKAYACRYYTRQGYTGIFSIVEAHNLNSLRSNLRMGAEVAGSLYVLMLFDRYRTYRDFGSRQLDCSLGPLDKKLKSSE